MEIPENNRYIPDNFLCLNKQYKNMFSAMYGIIQHKRKNSEVVKGITYFFRLEPDGRALLCFSFILFFCKFLFEFL